MRKYLILAAFVAVSTGAYAEGGFDKTGKKKGGFLDNLTEEQRECVKDYGCPKPERKEGEKLSKEEMESFRECHKKAFESCGIEMPEPKMKKDEARGSDRVEEKKVRSRGSE